MNLSDEEKLLLMDLSKSLRKKIQDNGEIVYMESNTKEQIIKKIYRTSALDKNIHIEFHCGYKCELNLAEFGDFINNINIPYMCYMQDMGRLKTVEQQDIPINVEN